MKISTTDSQGFSPITVSITLETPRELEIMKNIFALDSTVPSRLHTLDHIPELETKEVMQKLFKPLLKLWKQWRDG